MSAACSPPAGQPTEIQVEIAHGATIATQRRGSGARSRRLALGIALAVLVIDQAHKWWMLAVYGIEGRGRVTVMPFLDLVFVKNTGVSYGLFLQE